MRIGLNLLLEAVLADQEQQEDRVHTASHPYCADLVCWCHIDTGYHDLVQHPVYSDRDIEQACSFYGLEGLVWLQ